MRGIRAGHDYLIGKKKLGDGGREVEWKEEGRPKAGYVYSGKRFINNRIR